MISLKQSAISGSWRTTNEAVKSDVESAVEEIYKRGNSLVVGGALGVDQIATEKMLALNTDGSQLLIILPTSLDIFEGHFQMRAKQAVISNKQADQLISLLQMLLL